MSPTPCSCCNDTGCQCLTNCSCYQGDQTHCPCRRQPAEQPSHCGRCNDHVCECFTNCSCYTGVQGYCPCRCPQYSQKLSQAQIQTLMANVASVAPSGADVSGGATAQNLEANISNISKALFTSKFGYSTSGGAPAGAEVLEGYVSINNGDTELAKVYFEHVLKQHGAPEFAAAEAVNHIMAKAAEVFADTSVGGFKQVTFSHSYSNGAGVSITGHGSVLYTNIQFEADGAAPKLATLVHYVGAFFESKE